MEAWSEGIPGGGVVRGFGCEPRSNPN